MYSNLFDEIVRKTNLSFKTAATVHKFVAVLDIYGFEQFEVRKSFLLITYSEDLNNEHSNRGTMGKIVDYYFSILDSTCDLN